MKNTLLFIFSLLTLSLSAQDIKFDALTNGGGRISSTNSVSFTIGQPIVGTISNGGQGGTGETGGTGGDWGSDGSDTADSGNGGDAGDAIVKSSGVSVIGTINSNTIKGSY